MLRSILPLCLVVITSFSANGAEPPAKPKLLVLVVFDQMRGDYPERWRKLYGKDGFEKMMTEGAWYPNCHYPYATTVTGAGHSSLLTGTCPDKHGIIGNAWYDRESHSMVNCATSSRYDRVPSQHDNKPGDKDAGEDEKSRGCPDRLLSPTVADVLKVTTHGDGKAIGLSFKDRGAVLTVGKKADVAYWLDGSDGMMITSTYYRTTPNSWITEINQKRNADKWFGKTWTHLLENVDYQPYSGPDDVQGEGIGDKQGRAFPHPMNGGKDKISRSYFNALFNSPFGNEFLLEVAKAAIEGEKLGQRDTTDLLTVSFSSNDAIGHCWGPDSQEVMDVTLRSDRIMADLLIYLDAKVGKGNYLLALSADHGICPLPEVSASKGIDAKRMSAKDLLGDIEGHLSKKFGALPARSRWLESVSPPWIYLNLSAMKQLNLKPEEVEKAAAAYLAERPGVHKVYTRTQLLTSDFKGDDIGLKMKRSFYPDRAGDVGFELKPYYLLGGGLTGTNHGTPYDYDTHVPLLVYGWNTQAGVHKELVHPQQIATIFAKALSANPPKDAEFGLPPGVFK